MTSRSVRGAPPGGVTSRPGRRRLVARAVAVGLVGMAVVGCAPADPQSDAGAPTGARHDTLMVSVASSLAGAFAVIAQEFGAAHEVEVTVNVDASSTLVTQVLEGAPVDVVALAATASMQRLTDADALAGDPEAFATTTLVIVTPPSNPAGITSLSDLADLPVVALCAPEAPCGRYAAEALADAGVTLDEWRVTRARNASATLAAVADGDALAGIVYATDAMSAGERVAVVALPATSDVVATYSIAATSRGATAQAFVDWVVGPRGRATLARAGFAPPPGAP